MVSDQGFGGSKIRTLHITPYFGSQVGVANNDGEAPTVLEVGSSMRTGMSNTTLFKRVYWVTPPVHFASGEFCSLVVCRATRAHAGCSWVGGWATPHIHLLPQRGVNFGL